jgi:hypothetical protein
MRWITRSQLHLDRAACVWLVRRFIDPDHAEFVFVDWDVTPDLGRADRSFGVPGVGVGAHDDQGTAFAKLARLHDLDGEPLAQMARIVACGVADALDKPMPADASDAQQAMGVALNRLGSALAVAFDDSEHVDVAFRLYEGVYAICQVDALPPWIREGTPAPPPQRVAYLRRATGRADYRAF